MPATIWISPLVPTALRESLPETENVLGSAPAVIVPLTVPVVHGKPVTIAVAGELTDS